MLEIRFHGRGRPGEAYLRIARKNLFIRNSVRKPDQNTQAILNAYDAVRPI